MGEFLIQINSQLYHPFTARATKQTCCLGICQASRAAVRKEHCPLHRLVEWWKSEKYKMRCGMGKFEKPHMAFQMAVC
jgi:hypothetical protein